MSDKSLNERIANALTDGGRALIGKAGESQCAQALRRCMSLLREAQIVIDQPPVAAPKKPSKASKS